MRALLPGLFGGQALAQGPFWEGLPYMELHVYTYIKIHTYSGDTAGSYVGVSVGRLVCRPFKNHMNSEITMLRGPEVPGDPLLKISSPRVPCI